jgi:hypothetical protein
MIACVIILLYSGCGSDIRRNNLKQRVLIEDYACL